ncbi:Uncharacterised protein [Salmonella enterica subsp. enterica serovar Typhimurium]|nr:Uncharacterised protein [Salmonella enterica subsp. enterica serovar Typhimurium]
MSFTTLLRNVRITAFCGNESGTYRNGSQRDNGGHPMLTPSDAG